LSGLRNSLRSAFKQACFCNLKKLVCYNSFVGWEHSHRDGLFENLKESQMTTALERTRTKRADVAKRIATATANRDRAIKMLITQETALKRLACEEARLAKRNRKLTEQALANVTEPIVEEALAKPDGGIPAFLQRDKAIAAEIKAEVEDKKKRKARGRVARMLAAKAGETTRMPLEGREAERFLKTL
jgi:hypothetical protein